MNKLVAIVGMSGSGKSISSEYLKEKGWNKIYFGGVIYDEMRKQGITITPDSQKEFRENIRKKLGMGAVAILLLPEIEKALKEKDTVLDGLYSWDEYLILKEKFPELQLICVVCDKKIRYNRVSKRIDRPFDLNDIIKRDVSEIENLAKGGPIAISDYYIFNNGNIDEYIERLEEIIQNI